MILIKKLIQQDNLLEKISCSCEPPDLSFVVLAKISAPIQLREKKFERRQDHPIYHKHMTLPLKYVADNHKTSSYNQSACYKYFRPSIRSNQEKYLFNCFWA